MTLTQFQALKVWHTRHSAECPLEKNIWDIVLMFWLTGWVGLPATLLLGQPLAGLACLGLCLLPGAYVAWRKRLHQAGRLRCDWVIALR
jgi:hypothetical protein